MRKLNVLDVIIEFYLKKELDSYYNLMLDDNFYIYKNFMLLLEKFIL